MSFKGKYIIAAIDGTNSDQRLISHVWKFYKQIDGRKAYWEGPKGASGRGSSAKVEGVASWINREIRSESLRIGKERLALDTSRSGYDYAFRKPFLSLSRNDQAKVRAHYAEHIRVILFGYSRGGPIAICAAKKIILPVYWLGLFDAVAMHVSLSIGAREIKNVDFVNHARRHPLMKSRASWGNCGLKPKNIIEDDFFFTSHGGMGGEADTQSSLTGDNSCIPGSRHNTMGKVAYLSVHNKTIDEFCVTESHRVYTWMRDKARSKELKI